MKKNFTINLPREPGRKSGSGVKKGLAGLGGLFLLLSGIWMLVNRLIDDSEEKDETT